MPLGWSLALAIGACWFLTWIRHWRDDVLLQSLILLHRKVDDLMASETELQTTLDAIKAGVVAVVDRLTAQAKTITDLQAQLAAGTPVSQQQLDALTAEANDIAAVLAPLAAPATT